jgi:hypothetical protein
MAGEMPHVYQAVAAVVEEHETPQVLKAGPKGGPAEVIKG